MKKYLDGICVPFETGTGFLTIPLIEDADRKIHEFAHDRATLVDRFLDSYPALCESMSERLRAPQPDGFEDQLDYTAVDIVWHRVRMYEYPNSPSNSEALACA